MKIYSPLLATLMLVPAITLPAANLSSNNQPNILFILADNWRWPTAGALGDPMARTPAFDRIAHEGVVFTHTFNSSPSCSPSRASMLTGRYPHELGERANLWSAFPKDTPVVMQLLREAGYDFPIPRFTKSLTPAYLQMQLYRFKLLAAP